MNVLKLSLKLSLAAAVVVALAALPSRPQSGGSGPPFNAQFGAGAPTVNCTPPSQGALARMLYWDTTNFVWYYCSAANTWTLFGSGAAPATRYTIRTCQPGLGDGLNAIPAGTYLVSECLNEFGSTFTITAIKCFTDNNGTSTLNVTNSAATGLLTGAVTCTNAFAAGTQSATTTLASGDYAKWTFVADGTSKQVTFVLTGTL